ncbi:DUF2970 domain-containing protein [Thaumasiovibrio sp. DFM-14]|uniref:DUF2970 domain-containing protein n=1 Tax=Thaumasiovibrio sp. DFM-14 TaxID=3384792 RepID=UPI0039A32CC5
MDKNRKSSRWWQIMLSVFAALIGVQSDKKRQHDFNQHSPIPYIVIGIMMIAFFTLGLVQIVKYVISG